MGGSPSPAPVTEEVMPVAATPARSDAQTQALADQQRANAASTSNSDSSNSGYRTSGSAATYLTSGGTTASSSAIRFLGGAART